MAMDSPAVANFPERMKWYLDARFGMSVHWGLYSIPGQGEWIRSHQNLTIEQYQKYFDAFSPDRGCMREWAQLAKSTGMRYCILTTKHHDGFCLFDSKLTEYKATNAAAKRDLIAEYVDALREQGIRVGFYYSLVDWHHPDYPAWHDRQHPLKDNPASIERDKQCVWERYLEYMHGQIEELLSNYGVIDLLALDFSYWEYRGEKWGATELVKKIRRLQPDIILNDRLGFEPMRQETPPPYAGDVNQSEQDIPRLPVTNARGELIPWESWFTVTNSWCYNPNFSDYKEPVDIIRALANCVSKGGNLLLNVAPDAAGHVDERSVRTLHEVGEWLSKHGESIYGCGISGLPKPEWGRFTRRGTYLYAHLTEQVIGQISLPGLRGRVKNGFCLTTGEPVKICDFWNPGVQIFDEPDDIFFNFRSSVSSTYILPDRRDTVVRFEFTTEEEREQLCEEYRQAYVKRTTPRER